MVKGLEHVGIMVKDMDQSISFYSQAFGFHTRERAHINPEVELAFLYLPHHPEVEVELICGPPMVNEEGKVNHLAFRVERIEEEMLRLQSLGAELTDLEPRTILGNIKIAFLKGPNGEKLELVERE